MVTAKFIGGYMDGEIIMLERAYPFYRFPRRVPMSSMIVTDKDPSKTVPIWTEDYELDVEHNRIAFYRHTKVGTSIRRYYQ